MAILALTYLPGVARVTWPRLPRRSWALGGAAAMTAGGIIAALSSGGSFAHIAGFAVVTIPLTLTAARLQPDRDECRWLIAALLAGIVVSTVAGFLLPTPPNGRAVGFTGHSNQYAMMAVMGLPLAWLLYRGSSRRNRAVVVAPVATAAAILLAGVLFSGSRSGLLALTVVLTVLVYRQLGAVPSLLVAVTAVTLVALLGLPAVDTPTTERLASSTSTAESDAARLDAMRGGLERLGGGEWVLGTSLDDAELLPHNVVLLVWVGMGLLGLFAFGYIVWHGLNPIGKRSRDVEMWGMSVAFAGFLLAISVNNALSVAPAWLILALLQSRTQHVASQTVLRRSPSDVAGLATQTPSVRRGLE
jgi:hypothetical protein